MKKPALSFLFRVIACPGFSFLLSFVVHAQTTSLDPSGWEEFVYSKNNVSIQDTFLMQTFNGSPDDNWGYTLVRNAKRMNTQDTEIKNAPEGQCLQLNMGAEVQFDRWDKTPRFPSARMTAPYAIHRVMPGENLYIPTELNGIDMVKQWTTILEDRYSAAFQEKKKYAAWDRPYIYVGSDHTSWFHFRVSDAAANTQGGFYAIDSAYVVRTIPASSLFTGEGNWQDSTCWSHYAASRNRQALVKGDVTVTGNQRCRSLLLGAGSVSVPVKSRLAVGELWLNDAGVSLYADGELAIDKRVTYRITFPEAGQWYFVSFPFNVYADGLDAGFRLQDGSQSGGGNFFYLKQYDGAARSRSGKATGNWKTVPAIATGGKEPVIRRGEGYLIALDKEASRHEMVFSVSAGLLPAGFGRDGSIAIEVLLPSGDRISEHHGWVLCGNPLPSPLSVSAIKPNADLDGYVYLYEAGAFKPYAFSSGKVLPPLSAFFVKARQTTTLVVQQPEKYRKPLPAFSSLMRYEGNEPEEASSPTGLVPVSAYRYELSEKGLRIIGLPAAGHLSIVDLAGRVVLRYPFAGGDTLIPLTLPAGNYILCLETGSNRTQYKFGWNN